MSIFHNITPMTELPDSPSYVSACACVYDCMFVRILHVYTKLFEAYFNSHVHGFIDKE